VSTHWLTVHRDHRLHVRLASCAHGRSTLRTIGHRKTSVSTRCCTATSARGVPWIDSASLKTRTWPGAGTRGSARHTCIGSSQPNAPIFLTYSPTRLQEIDYFKIHLQLTLHTSLTLHGLDCSCRLQHQLLAAYCQRLAIASAKPSPSIAEPNRVPAPAKSLASAPLIPFISCTHRHSAFIVCPLSHSRSPTTTPHHGVAQTHTSHSFTHSLTLPPPPTTAPPRPRANTMGSYTFRWYVMPFSKFHPPARKGKDASSAMEQRRARVRAGLKLAAVELSPSRLLGRAVLRYSHPRTRKSSHTSNTPRDLLTDCCCLHIGIILPKKYTLPAPLTAGPRVLSLTKTAHPSQRPSTSPPSTARSNTRCVAQDLPAAELPVNRHDRAHLFGYHQTFPLTPARSSSQTEIGNTITLPKPKQTTKET